MSVPAGQTISMTFPAPVLGGTYVLPSYVWGEEHVRVEFVDNAGDKTVAVLNTDYSVAPADRSEAGVTITLLVAPPAGTVELEVTRDTIIANEFVAPEEAKAFEYALDRLTLAMQELNAIQDFLLSVGIDVAAAQAAAALAAQYLDEFTDIYLGAFATNPTTDNDGDPLQAGMFYLNTTVGELRFYDGASWLPYSPGTAATTADAVTIADAGGYYVGPHVEAALQEAGADLDALDAAKYDASDLASQAEAEAGTDNTKLMTPLRVAQAIAALGGTGQVLDSQVFTASGTWDNTVEPGGILVSIEVWGGGGGGGEAQPGGSEAEGGGGGEYRIILLSRTALFENVPVTIGAGGVGAPVSTGNHGGAGGQTSFGVLIGAKGGAGGKGSDSGGPTAPAEWVEATFYAPPLAYRDVDGAPESEPNANGAGSVYAGAAGAGAKNSSPGTKTGGLAQYLNQNGGSWDYSTGPTAGGYACGGAAGRSMQGGAAGGNGFCVVTIFGIPS